MTRVDYWLKGEPEQNFGDYVSEFLLDELFHEVGDSERVIRVIGSAIHDWFVPESSIEGSPVTFWGCGIRERSGLSPERRNHARILSVRGPVSAGDLRLGADIPLGDPALLFPALYEPQRRAEFSGKSICIPHFHDGRTDSEISRLSGCDSVLRPRIPVGKHNLLRFVDALHSAEFVLSGALHGAVVAAAYGRPFAFWASGQIDLALKWDDFAESVGLDAHFCETVGEGRQLYATYIEPRIKLPSMWASLARAPFLIRSDALLKVLRYELAREGVTDVATQLEARIREFNDTREHFASIAKRSFDHAARLDDRVLSSEGALKSAHERLNAIGVELTAERTAATTALAEMEKVIAALRSELEQLRAQEASARTETEYVHAAIEVERERMRQSETAAHDEAELARAAHEAEIARLCAAETSARTETEWLRSELETAIRQRSEEEVASKEDKERALLALRTELDNRYEHERMRSEQAEEERARLELEIAEVRTREAEARATIAANHATTVTELESARAELARADCKRTELETELERLRAAEAAARNELEKLGTRLEQLQRQESAARADAEQLRTALGAEIVQLRWRETAARDHSEQLRTEILQARAHESAGRAETDRVRAALTAERDGAHALRAAERAANEQVQGALRAEIERLRAVELAATCEAEQVRASLGREIDELRKLVRAARLETEEVRSALEVEIGRLQALECAGRTQHEKTRVSLEAELEALQSQNVSLRAERSRLHLTLEAELVEARARETALAEKLGHARAALDALERQGHESAEPEPNAGDAVASSSKAQLPPQEEPRAAVPLSAAPRTTAVGTPGQGLGILARVRQRLFRSERRKLDAELILASGLFDSDWYRAQVPSIGRSRAKAVTHYIERGGREGWSPHPLFDSRFYLDRYPDVANAGANALIHYLTEGAREGRWPHPLFDPRYYLSQFEGRTTEVGNPLVHYLRVGGKQHRSPHPLFDSRYYSDAHRDVSRGGVSPLVHYVTEGARQGLSPHPLFDAGHYLQHNADVATSGVDPLVHYLTRGAREGRSPHPLFDGEHYLRENPDVEAAGFDPLTHYVLSGAREGRSPHLLFDGRFYLESNPDVAERGLSPLAHYVVEGCYEGRSPHPLFDAKHYLEQLGDSRNARVNPLVHYVTCGAREGRAPNRLFHTAGYAFDNPDVAEFEGNALAHYLRVGRSRGASPHPLFDPDYYLAQNPDVAASGVDPLEHFLRKGHTEGRAASLAADRNTPLDQFGIELPRVEQEAVTIIVPAYRNFRDTYRCLYSLSRRTATSINFKVVVADDCPDRPLAPLLGGVSGLSIQSNAANLGFLGNCNHAAKLARSKYIVFLNNDTVVTDGWLTMLVQQADRDPLVGMVGSKLLNLDGTVQEAGGIMFRDGWGHPYGRGDRPDRPEYNYVREVDCVIGACFLVRRDVFEQVGRFDERYKPAFFEEFDLAFAVNEAGYRVLYQPASEVYHLGSASYGADARDRQSAINHDRFVRKWAATLAGKFDGPAHLFFARERKHESGVILVIDDMVPEYDKYAGALTIFQYVRLLTEQDFKVIYLPHDRRPSQPYTTTLQQLGVEVLYGDFDLEAWFDTNGRHLDWVWAARPDTARHYLELVRRSTSARFLYYTHDLHFLREARRFEVEGDAWARSESERLRPIEIGIFDAVDCVTTPSSEEAAIIKQLSPGREVRVVTPYFYRREPREEAKVEIPLEQRTHIIFVGGFGHLPNVDAAMFLVRNVMPKVWEQVPEARVLVVGSNPPAEIRALADHRVEVTGHVPDLGPYYARARMSVCPLRYGAGVKGKIVSCLEAGVPVITTTIGNEGIALESGVEALIGDTSEELAAHVVRLFRDPELPGSLVRAGGDVIAQRFNEDSARDRLFVALDCFICRVCGARARPKQRPPSTNWREEPSCERCYALNRTQALADALLMPYRRFRCASIADALGYLRDVRIHEFSIVGPVRDILSKLPNFTCSEYFDDVRGGSRAPNGVMCQDIQALTFGSGELDLCISQDVLEHVPDPERGLRELFRVLKPGGKHLFTVPYGPQRTTSLTRARVRSGRLEHLVVPEYHGDPIRAEGALVFTDFGRDLVRTLERIGFRVAIHETIRHERRGGYVAVFETTRPI